MVESVKNSECRCFLRRVVGTFLLPCCLSMAMGCNPASNRDHIPEPCKAVFHPNGMNFELAKDFSADDLVAVERCGFAYHPRISFYEYIVRSREYPIPALLKSLHGSDDAHWKIHVVYLVKEVIESERYRPEVLRDRKMIMDEIDSSISIVELKGDLLVRFRDLKDGIDIYFLKDDAHSGMKIPVAWG